MIHKKSTPESAEKTDEPKPEKDKHERDKHIGSSSAFDETENPASEDPDNISDERLDELIGD